MFETREVVVTGAVAGLLAAVGLAVWPWARARGRFAAAGLGTFVGWCIWNLALDAAGASGFNVDAPVVALSGQDVGSGIMAYAVTALGLSVLDRHQPAGRVAAAALIVGVIAMVYDIFVL